MEFRKAKKSDEKGIAHVLMKSYNINSLKEGIDAFRAEMKKGHNFVVAVENGKIIGIASWVSHGLPKHQLAELDRIAVLPEYRGKGVSDKLFRFLLEDVKNFYISKKSKLRKFFVLTHADNKRAQEFYKRVGFRFEAKLKDHYYKDKDEYVMSMFFR
jgi:ribosomal-protein-alanine N-acetyltransferase